jgi:hypothetical protein
MSDSRVVSHSSTKELRVQGITSLWSGQGDLGIEELVIRYQYETFLDYLTGLRSYENWVAGFRILCNSGIERWREDDDHILAIWDARNCKVPIRIRDRLGLVIGGTVEHKRDRLCVRSPF